MPAQAQHPAVNPYKPNCQGSAAKDIDSSSAKVETMQGTSTKVPAFKIASGQRNDVVLGDTWLEGLTPELRKQLNEEIDSETRKICAFDNDPSRTFQFNHNFFPKNINKKSYIYGSDEATALLTSSQDQYYLLDTSQLDANGRPAPTETLNLFNKAQCECRLTKLQSLAEELKTTGTKLLGRKVSGLARKAGLYCTITDVYGFSTRSKSPLSIADTVSIFKSAFMSRWLQHDMYFVFKMVYVIFIHPFNDTDWKINAAKLVFSNLPFVKFDGRLQGFSDRKAYHFVTRILGRILKRELNGIYDWFYGQVGASIVTKQGPNSQFETLTIRPNDIFQGSVGGSAYVCIKDECETLADESSFNHYLHMMVKKGSDMNLSIETICGKVTEAHSDPHTSVESFLKPAKGKGTDKPKKGKDKLYSRANNKQRRKSAEGSNSSEGCESGGSGKKKGKRPTKSSEGCESGGSGKKKGKQPTKSGKKRKHDNDTTQKPVTGSDPGKKPAVSDSTNKQTLKSVEGSKPSEGSDSQLAQQMQLQQFQQFQQLMQNPFIQQQLQQTMQIQQLQFPIPTNQAVYAPMPQAYTNNLVRVTFIKMSCTLSSQITFSILFL